jgi:ABC-2 type transport system permease protein
VSAAAVPRLLWFARVLVAFVRRELAALGGYRMAFLIRVLGFGLAIGSLLFLSRFVGAAVNPHLTLYRGNYLGFVVIGLLGTEFQQVGVSVLAQRIRMAQMMGTLEAEVATPADPWMVLGAPPVYEFVVAAGRSATYLGLDLSHANWSSVLVAVPLIVAAFSGLGLLAAATTMLVRRLNPVAMVIASLSFFLSGVMYPVTVLPAWLREVGRFLPLTHALAVLRGALLVGAGPGDLGQSLLALLVFAGVLAPVGVGTFAHALRRARIDGSLSHY